MVKKFLNLSSGYTLVEMMVVIAVMTFIGTIGFFGLRSADQNQKLNTTAKELVSDLRASQNFINSGGNIKNTPIRVRKFVFDGSSTYTVSDYDSSLNLISGSTRSNLPTAGIVYSAVTVCFLNPNATISLSGCPTSTQNIAVTNTNISENKVITVEMLNSFVTKIYQQ